MKAFVLLLVLYFDAHNHFPGILPYEAYANLPAYVAHFADPHAGPTLDDKRALLHYLATVWYPRHGAALGNRPFSPPDGQRFALGARATLVVYRNRTDERDVDGALERVLTATPWSEFDSAYAFRGGPAGDYLRTRFYRGDEAALGADLCRATVLDLAATNIDASEQSIPLVGGFHFENGRSDQLDTLTAQLATPPRGATYSEWSRPVTAPRFRCLQIETTPATIYSALMGLDDGGRAVIPQAQRTIASAPSPRASANERSSTTLRGIWRTCRATR